MFKLLQKHNERSRRTHTVTRLTAAASCDCKSTKFLANELMSSEELELYLPRREGQIKGAKKRRETKT
jgi:hypothetical protein